ncbi:transposase domain-containing protein [Streptomyces sp. Root264]|uniref:transposase domain-containing protein n=1 Tax=unclassified Streptomyces TaxID=2593676 RepID=UPI000710BE38|nr:hypothetical protein ASE41_12610 [Streptomyces sp. Root264]
MVYFTLAPALFHQDSYDDVADHLVGGIPELSCCFPHKASFTRARERLGPEVLERLFQRLAGPLAPRGPVGGFLLDVPDNEAGCHALASRRTPVGSRAGFRRCGW